MRISDVIKDLQEMLDTVGDIEVKIETNFTFEICREVYLLARPYAANKFAVLSKDVTGYKKPRRDPYYKRQK